MMRIDPETALERVSGCLERANDRTSGYVPSDMAIRQAEVEIQLAHAYLRYVEVTTVKEKA